MSNLDASEVLSYLNELGYQNITAKQLKEFMKDLKKLIKYEKKCMATDNTTENIAPVTSPPCKYNSFTCSYSAPTESSKAKDVGSKKEQIVTVQIKRPTRPCHCPENYYKVKPVSKPSLQSNTTNTQGSQIISGSERKWYSDVPETNSEGVTIVNPKRPKSCDTECLKSSKAKFNNKKNSLRPKSSFIVPKEPIKTCKTDPVALYHRYQEVWKRMKLPGENCHSDLRWSIRERMLGGRPQAMSAAPSMEVIAKKRKTTNRI